MGEGTLPLNQTNSYQLVLYNIQDPSVQEIVAEAIRKTKKKKKKKKKIKKKILIKSKIYLNN